jgi:hypothetical protein
MPIPAPQGPPELGYQFSGPDSLARFVIGFVGWLGGGTFPPPLIAWWIWGWPGALAWSAGILLVVAGLRASIVFTPAETVVTRRWFLVPYWRHRAAQIDDVWFGGDWGLDDGAMGVVVLLAGKEVHLGSASTMHGLYAALYPLRRRPDPPRSRGWPAPLPPPSSA